MCVCSAAAKVHDELVFEVAQDHLHEVHPPFTSPPWVPIGAVLTVLYDDMLERYIVEVIVFGTGIYTSLDPALRVVCSSVTWCA